VTPATRGRGRGRGGVTRGGRPIRSGVLMEAPPDPALGHIGGAEIQHNTEADDENPLPLIQETQQDNNLTPPTRSDLPVLTWHGPDNHLFRSNSPLHDPFFDNNNTWSFEEEQAIQVSTAPPLTQGTADAVDALTSLLNSDFAQDAPQDDPQDGPEGQCDDHDSEDGDNCSNASDLDAPLDDDLAAQISSELNKSGVPGLNEEEKKRVEGCKRGKNKSEYTQKQRSHEKKFFVTLTECGGRTLSGLLPIKANYSSKGIDDRQFYNTVGGPKTPEKQTILNACLLLCLAKWTKTHGPIEEHGKPYQPSAFRQMIKELFYLFHKKGIQYKFDLDFDDIGEFHGVLIDTWNDIRKKVTMVRFHP